MEKANAKFAKRLRAAMLAAGYEAKPAVLEREFNQHYMGSPITLHGVRRWLLGESLPTWKLVAAALVMGGLAVNLLWPTIRRRLAGS